MSMSMVSLSVPGLQTRLEEYAELGAVTASSLERMSLRFHESSEDQRTMENSRSLYQQERN